MHTFAQESNDQGLEVNNHTVFEIGRQTRSDINWDGSSALSTQEDQKESIIVPRWSLQELNICLCRKVCDIFILPLKSCRVQVWKEVWSVLAWLRLSQSKFKCGEIAARCRNDEHDDGEHRGVARAKIKITRSSLTAQRAWHRIDEYYHTQASASNEKPSRDRRRQTSGSW